MDVNGKQMVYMALLEASSQDTDVLKRGEAKLKSWEVQPGFYTTLCDIFLNTTLQENARWLATLYFKNGIDKYWRTTAPNGISPEEKTVLRSRLLDCLNQPINQLANQMAIIISKIARFDCPKEWPDLIDILFNNMKNTNNLIKHRAVLYLYHVVKSLSTKRLIGDRKLFHDLSSAIYSSVLNYWNSSMIEFGNMASNGQGDVKDILSVLMLCSKVLRKLTELGFAKPHQSQDVSQFISLIFERVKLMLEYRAMTKDDCLRQLLEKIITVLIKTLLTMLEQHPLAYVPFIQASLEFSFYYGFTPEGSRFMFPEALIRSLNLMKIILTCTEYRKYRPNEITADSKYENLILAHQIKTEFFTDAILDTVIRKLASEYFLLSQEDLSCWQTNPESFISDEGGECWKYNLRPCTESLFMAITREFSDPVTEIVCSLVEDCRSPVISNDINAVLKKDAIYTAFGLSVFDLYMEVCFDSWFRDVLIPELHDKSSNNRILRRKISWLISRWTGIRFSTSLRPLLYSEMIKLLEPDEDMVVKLTTCFSMKQIIDDFDFDSSVFVDFLPQYFHLLYVLLEEVSECETKMRVLHVLSFILERVGWSIAPHLDSLIQYLPLLWQHSADHNMLKSTIVSTLTSIVKGLKKRCTSMSSFICMVVEYSLDFNQDGHVYLLDNGLQLFLAFVENVSSDNGADILKLFDRVLPVLEMTYSEHLVLVCSITRAFILLTPDLFMQMYSDKLVASFKNHMYTGSVLGVYELCVRINPVTTVQYFRQPLQCIVEYACGVSENGDKNTTIGPLCFCIISRLIIHSLDTFGQLMLSVSENLKVSFDYLFTDLLKTWLKEVPYVPLIPKRKLWCIAFITLLSLKSEVIFVHFNPIVNAITDAIDEVISSEASDSYLESIIPSCVYDVIDPNYCEDKSEHDNRGLDLDINDVVETVDLLKYFRSKIETLKNELGNDFIRLTNALDKVIIEKIQSYSLYVPPL